MRGSEFERDARISTVAPETRVSEDHPLRPIQRMVDEVLEAFDGEFAGSYSMYGHESIPPEMLLRARVRGQTERASLLSKEHVSLDGTMI